MIQPGNPPLRHQLPRRLSQLYLGLGIYGLSMGLMIQARLGSMPWDVFHQGVARRTGLGFGWVVIGVGAVVLLLWVPLRQRPGIGTVSNVVVIGVVADLALQVLPAPQELPSRICFLLLGVILNALAGGLYIGAALGPGPRDGLMTGLVARTGGSIRLIRTGLEVLVVLAGWALGGTFGVGTLLYAVSVGPLVQILLPRLTVRAAPPAPTPAALALAE